MSNKQLSPKDAAERVPITFDFSNIVSTINSITSTSVTLIRGTDVNVGTMIEGLPLISGLAVVQLVKNGVNGNMYEVRADIVSGEERYALSALLPVEEQ